MEGLELCRLLDRRQLQHQHLDDQLVHGIGWSVVVAVMAVCVDRLRHSCMLCVLDWSYRRYLSHWISCREQELLRNLGQFVACLQQSCYGVHLVWCAELHRGRMHLPDDSVDMEVLGESNTL